MATTTSNDITTTSYTQATVDTAATVPPSASLLVEATTTQETPPSPSTSVETTLPTTIRQMPDTAYLPLLILLQYLSTAWITELVATSFANESIHQTAVSTTKKGFKLMLFLIAISLTYHSSWCI